MPSSPTDEAEDGVHDRIFARNTRIFPHRMDARRLPSHLLAAPAGAASRRGKPAIIATASRRRKPEIGPGSASCGVPTPFPRHAAGKRHLALHHHVRQQGGEA
jgi:hypothetical protein